MTEADSALDQILIGELTTPVDPRLHTLVTQILGIARPLGVLFYGSGLRQFDPEGLFDFYIVLERLSDWPASPAAMLANHLLPPNVFYAEHEIDGQVLRAKIAVLTVQQLRAGASPRSTDTTLWARFCQPVRLVWVRNPEAADTLLAIIRSCVTTAAGWTARLEEGAHPPEKWWEALFRRTYRAELRVEKSARGSVIMQGQDARYAALTRPAWQSAGLAFDETGGCVAPRLSKAQRLRAGRRWERMAHKGRWRNVARLIKAAFTFKNGAAYLAWKIERHSGFVLKLSPFEARHPLICLPRLLWRARKIFLSGMQG
ncbi:hypothetical protein [Asaia spathodeae]|uniref:Phosphatidate cytidylyltransferase n=1 Tax=Asaia spathodeae TaxID=657016 RepID=A0ABX2P4E5_9PROT|nr:hypothetical protein [Asaia spathodeae]GBR22786.1 hypothetical protein AA105894_3146 [Asaia spathodeae NBRC 105894]